MHYLANYYKNLSEQLQEKVNFLEKQLEEAIDTYVPVPMLKSGKGGNYAEWKDAVDKRNAMKRAENLGLLGKKLERKPITGTTPKPETKPSKPGIEITPQRKPSLPAFDYLTLGREPNVRIGKVPGLDDTDAINIMPEPDRDAINIIPQSDYKFHDSNLYGSRKKPTLSPEDMKRKDLGIPMTDKLRRSFGETKPYIQ